MKFRPSVRIGVSIFGLVSGVILLIAAIGIMNSAIWFPILLIAISIVSLVLIHRNRKRQQQNDFDL